MKVKKSDLVWKLKVELISFGGLIKREVEAGQLLSDSLVKRYNSIVSQLRELENNNNNSEWVLV